MEALLADAAWLRRLVERLVRDPEEAADLQQDVAVAALRADGRPAGRPWLAAVARRLAALRRRRAAREVARLARLVPTAAAASAADVVADAELQRRAVDAVLALPPHYRDTILLRFLRGLSVDATARQLGVGIDTVRVRQKRALARLRRQLVAPARSAWLGIPVLGGLMGLQKKFAAAVVLVVFGVLGSSPLWWDASPPPPGVERAASAPDAGMPSLAASAAAPDAARIAVEDANAAPAPDLEAAAPAPAELPPAPPTPSTPVGGLLVTVVEPGGQPAGAGHAILCRAAAGPGEVRESDAASQVRFGELPPGRYRVGTIGLRHQSVVVAAGRVSELTVTLVAGVTIAGRVVDAEGRPVPHARIHMQHGSAWPAWPFPVGRADAGGRFEVGGGAPLEMLFASDGRLGRTAGRLLREVDLAPGAPTTIELRFAGGALAGVRGRVVEPSGAPVARAWVQLRPEGGAGTDTMARLWATDAEGWFAGDGLPAGRVQLYVYAAGWAPHRERLQLDPAATAGPTVVLARGSTVRGVVRDAVGAPVAGAFVRADGLAYPQRFHQQTGADGAFLFDDVPDGAFTLAAWQKDASRVRCEVRLDGPGEHAIEMVLGEAERIRGRLLDARGQPLANWFVTRPGSGRWTATDREGAFVCVECRESGNELHVRPNVGGTPVHAVFRDLRAGTQEQVLVVADACMPSARILGRAVDALGRAVEGARLRLGQYDSTVIQPARTGADGGFALGPLPPGPYRLEILQDGRRFPPVDVVLEAHQELYLEPVFELR
ncbi:MAG: sigma-70 family RNA polymerase sigma factor [Planctomycetota bacterium]